MNEIETKLSFVFQLYTISFLLIRVNFSDNQIWICGALPFESALLDAKVIPFKKQR